MRFIYQIIAVFGMLLVSSAINLITGGKPEKIYTGYLLLIPGVIFSAGGLAPITYLFIKEFRAKVTAAIRGARLYIEEQNPGEFRLCFFVELIITPPDGYNPVFISDDLKARIDGFVEHPLPIEFSNLGISPSTNPRVADGTYAELMVPRQTGVVCDGVATLMMPPETLTFPERLVYDSELMGRRWQLLHRHRVRTSSRW